MANTFYDYFKESSESCGVPAPPNLFGGFASATSLLAACLKVVENFSFKAACGAKAAMTVKDLFAYLRLSSAGAGVTLSAVSEILVAVGGCTAAYVLGVWIGALSYAAGKCFEDVDFAPSRGFWEWWYDVPAKDREYAQNQARLATMKRHQAVDELIARAQRTGIQIDPRTWPGTVLSAAR